MRALLFTEVVANLSSLDQQLDVTLAEISLIPWPTIICLMGLFDVVHRTDHDYVERYLLEQFLSGSQYFLETFNSVCRPVARRV